MNYLRDGATYTCIYIYHALTLGFTLINCIRACITQMAFNQDAAPLAIHDEKKPCCLRGYDNLYTACNT